MPDTAKIFMTGRSQAVRLPAAYRFDTPEVSIRRDPRTGDIILSPRPADWHDVLAVIRAQSGADLFPDGRKQEDVTRNPLDGLNL